MIIFLEYGRLGNQAFQLLALRILFDRHIVLVGFSSLRHLLKPSVFRSVSFVPLKSAFIRSKLAQAIRFLAGLRLITLYRPYYYSNKFELTKKIGLIRWPEFVDTSDFQHPIISSQIQPSQLFLKDSLQNNAASRIRLLQKQYTNRPIVFVHIRRGDYVRWPTSESPAVLPCEWYFRAMTRMRELLDCPLFFIVTDDIPYAKDILGSFDDVCIEANDEYQDIAFMANCCHGILSASSFSWLGAYLSYSKNMEEKLVDKQLFFAPDPWIIRQSSTMPPSLNTPWLTALSRKP